APPALPPVKGGGALQDPKGAPKIEATFKNEVLPVVKYYMDMINRGTRMTLNTHMHFWVPVGMALNFMGGSVNMEFKRRGLNLLSGVLTTGPVGAPRTGRAQARRAVRRQKRAPASSTSRCGARARTRATRPPRTSAWRPSSTASA